MLYDKRWDAKVEPKAEPLSLDSLIAWLEKQPHGKKYDFFNCDGGCLIGQYLTAKGVYRLGNAISTASELGFYDIAGGKPRTFGAALDRARQHQSGMLTEL